MEELTFDIVFKTADGANQLGSLTVKLHDVEKAAGGAKQQSQSLWAEFVKGGVAMSVLNKAYDLLSSSIHKGMEEMKQADAAFARASVTARQTGVAFGEMVHAAEQLESPVLDADDALSMLSQLMNKGFKLDQAKELVRDLQNIAAVTKPAGTTVKEFMDKMVNAFVKGRVASADMQRALPGLKEALAAVGAGASQAEKNQILLNVAHRQGQADAGGLTNYLKTLQGQQEALNHSTDEVKKSLAEGFAPAVQEVIGSILGALGPTKDWKAAAFDLGQTIGQWLVGAFKIAIGAGQGFMAFLEIMKGVFYGVSIVALQTGKSILDFAAKGLEGLKALVAKNPFTSKEQLAGYDTAIAKLKDYSGTLSTMQDKATEGFSKTTDAAYTYAKKGLDNIGDALAGTSLATNRFNQSAGETPPILESAGQEALKFAEKIKKLKAEMQEWLDKQNEQIQADEFKKSQTVISDYTEIMKAMHGSWEDVIKTIDKFDGSMAATNPIVAKALEQLKQHRNALADDGTKITEQEVALRNATAALEENNRAMERAANRAAALAQILGMLGQSIGGVAGNIISQLIPTMDQMVTYGQQIMDTTGSMTATIAGQFGVMASMIGNAIGGPTGGLISSIGSFAATGAMFGPWGAAVGGALGAVLGLFKMFAHDWEKDTQTVLKQFGLIGSVSDQLFKKLAEDAKELHDAGSSVVVNLGAIMQEKGLNKDNWAFYINSLEYGFKAMATGKITAQQLADTIKTVFPQMLDAAIQWGGGFIDNLQGVIDKMKETGVGMETLQSYFDQLQQKVKDIESAALSDMVTQVQGLGAAFMEQINKLKDATMKKFNLTKPDDWGAWVSDADVQKVRHRFNEMQMYFTDMVSSMRAQGASWAEIFQKVGPLWQQLADTAQQLGLKTSKAFKEMSMEMKIFQDHAAGFSHLDFVSKITADLLRMNALTKGEFANLEVTIANMWKNITKDMTAAQIHQSAQGRAAVQAMLPYLIQVLGIHNMTGMAISKQDQALIDLAKHYGLLPKNTSQVGLDPTVTALQNMLKVLEMIAKALGVTQQQLNTIGNTHVTAQVTIQYDSEGNPYVPGQVVAGEGTAHRHADLDHWMRVPYDNYLASLHRDEVIGPAPQNDRTRTRSNDTRGRRNSNGDTYVFNHTNERTIQNIIERKRRQQRGGFRMPEDTL